MRRRGDEIGVRHGARVDACGDQARDVRHVRHHDRADALRRRADAREVDDAGIRARADHDHLRLVLVGQPIELVVVDPLVVRLHAVGDDFVQQARKVERVAVRQVAAVREVHAEDGVARLHDREIHGHVGLRARVRLHVGVLGAEELLRAAMARLSTTSTYSQPP